MICPRVLSTPQKCSNALKKCKSIKKGPKVQTLASYLQTPKDNYSNQAHTVVVKSTTTVVRNFDTKALGRCGMTTTIMVWTTIVVNSPWLSLEG